MPEPFAIKSIAHPVNQVKLIPDLSAAAILNKAKNAVVLWYCLRALAWWGDSEIDTETALKGLVSTFNYSPAGAYSHINKANGKVLSLLYNNGRATIKIWGLLRLCESFGMARLTDSHYRLIPVSAFTTLRKRREQLYASIPTHKPKGVKGGPVTRQTIEDMTGLNKVQQRRYEIGSGTKPEVQRTPNYGFYQEQGALARAEYKPLKQEIFSKEKGFRQVNKRLGNTYHTSQEPGSRGMLRKVNRRLRNTSSILEEAQPIARRFFSTFRKLFKGLVRRTGIGKEGYYLINSRKRIKKGRLEWCLVSI
jgi:hypothetical protein